ncbi:MAG: hypothetical protein MUF63_05885 [Rhodobacteraceae bacterium]|nr:hypothetical protein [Paracoccaceae bacterium]
MTDAAVALGLGTREEIAAMLAG